MPPRSREKAPAPETLFQGDVLPKKSKAWLSSSCSVPTWNFRPAFGCSNALKLPRLPAFKKYPLSSAHVGSSVMDFGAGKDGAAGLVSAGPAVPPGKVLRVAFHVKSVLPSYGQTKPEATPLPSVLIVMPGSAPKLVHLSGEPLIPAPSRNRFSVASAP